MQKIGPGAFWPQFWTVLAAFLALFGVSWALLGVCGPLLGVSWAHLGRLWVALGRLFAGLGSHLRSWERSGVDFEGLWDGPEIDFEAPGAYFSMFFLDVREHALTYCIENCMNCCRNPLLAFTWAFRSPPAARRYVRSTWNGAKFAILAPKNYVVSPFVIS